MVWLISVDQSESESTDYNRSNRKWSLLQWLELEWTKQKQFYLIKYIYSFYTFSLHNLKCERFIHSCIYFNLLFRKLKKKYDFFI